MQKLMSTEDAELMAKTYRFLSQRGVPVTVSEHGSQLELWLTVASYSAHAKALLQELKHHPELLDQVDLNIDTKINIVKELNEQGIFNIKGSVAEVAKKLNISESSVYRYIKMVEQF